MEVRQVRLWRRSLKPTPRQATSNVSMTAMLRLVLSCVCVTSVLACHPQMTTACDCRLHELPIVLQPTRSAADVSSLRLFRSAFAVTRVGPYGHHFAVRHSKIGKRPDGMEDDFMPGDDGLLVSRSPDSRRLHIEVEHSLQDRPSLAPREGGPLPAEVASLERDLEHELRARCPASSSWAIRYVGSYREVEVDEILPVDQSPERLGRGGRVLLYVDEAMTRVVAAPSVIGTTWRAPTRLAIENPLEWVDFVMPRERQGRVLMVASVRQDATPAAGTPEELLLSRAVEAARRWGPHDSTMPVSAIVAKQGTSLLPRELHQRVHLRLLAIPKQGQRRELDLSLSVREAVGGVARGEESLVMGGRSMTVCASLALGQPTSNATGSGQPIGGTLTLRIEDALGNVVDRSYPATGNVWIDGDTVALPTGVDLPYPAPIPPHVLHGPIEIELPGRGDTPSVEFQVATEVAVDVLND